MSESASAKIAILQTSPGTYQYTITLTDTGTTTIGTFWFSWVPGAGFLPDLPSFVSPTGWQASLTDGPPPNNGYSIKWIANSPSDELQPGQSSNGFTFTTSTAPTTLFGNSSIHPGDPVTTSVVYSGGPFSDNGFTFSAIPPLSGHDFSGDGIADFLMFNGNTLVDGEYQNGSTTFTTLGGFGPEWQLVGSGDFLGDGKSAGLLYSNGSGAIYAVEAVNGQQSLTRIGGVGSEWSFVGSGDFIGGGRDDILLRNINGSLVVVRQFGLYDTIGGIGSEWSFGGQNGLSADFLGDGHTGFLMHSSGNNALVVGEDIGGTGSFTTIAFTGSEWSYLASGDLLGDGHQSFLLRNTSGSLAVGGYKNGSTSFTAIGGVGAEWQFIGSGDFLGDGKTGVLMHSTGSGATYELEVTNGQANYTRLTGWGNEWHAQT